MTYEYLFLGMVGVVLLAMLVGAAAGRTASIQKGFAVCLLTAVLGAGLAYRLTQGGADAGYAPLLAAAAGLFGLMISFSASLVSRRVLARRRKAA
ncbi:hypothetical protein V8Z80_08135 [Orrella sp. JC864]|uniref:hypothetical protein n=1 Tax=Orrella sp. JC864 TaxID=3120298 RepID=UPI0030082CA6